MPRGFVYFQSHRMIKNYGRTLAESWRRIVAGFCFLFALVLTSCVDSTVQSGEPEEEAAASQERDSTNFAGSETFEGWSEIDDPERDGWETEAFNDEAATVLKKLGEVLLSDVSDGGSTGMLAPDVTLIPIPEESPTTKTITAPGGFVIQRVQRSENSVERLKGAEPVVARLRETFRPEGFREARIKFKIISVNRDTPAATMTDVRVESLAINEDSAIERHSNWSVTWEQDPGSRAGATIASIRVLDRETSTRPYSGKLYFSDCTQSALEGDPTYETQILRGLTHWLERQGLRRATSIYGCPGIALGDVNGDGLEDLFLCETQGVPNCLFIQNPDGTLENRAADWNVDWLDDARSALLIDLDNDGDQDLAVATIGFLLVASNEGGSFQLQAALPCSEDVTHLAAADYDLDGRIDLYVAAYSQSNEAGASLSPLGGFYLDGGQGAPNRLFQNQTSTGGTWVFEDVTERTGMEMDNRGLTLSSVWEDFDQDGDPDLYVANDFGSNHLYRNDAAADGARTFVNIANVVGSKDAAFGMSAAWGDYNRDGRMDLYVGNMWSSAGKRITTQPNFKPGMDADGLKSYQHLARGNTLLRNGEHGEFEDVSDDAGVTMGRWAWSAPFTDFNNDGWEDIAVANGFITGTGPGDL